MLESIIEKIATKELETILKKLEIELLDTKGNVKSTYDLLGEISEKWGELKDE